MTQNTHGNMASLFFQAIYSGCAVVDSPFWHSIFKNWNIPQKIMTLKLAATSTANPVPKGFYEWLPGTTVLNNLKIKILVQTYFVSEIQWLWKTKIQWLWTHANDHAKDYITIFKRPLYLIRNRWWMTYLWHARF